MMLALCMFWTAEAAMLDRTAWLESRRDHAAVGDRGRSRGAYQIQRVPWQHYSRVPWRTGAHDPVESRRVARLILRDCCRAALRHGEPLTFRVIRRYYRSGGY
jgi:hypothetical protein